MILVLVGVESNLRNVVLIRGELMKTKTYTDSVLKMIDEIEVRSCERDEELLDMINSLRDGFIRELNKVNDKLKKLERSSI